MFLLSIVNTRIPTELRVTLITLRRRHLYLSFELTSLYRVVVDCTANILLVRASWAYCFHFINTERSRGGGKEKINKHRLFVGWLWPPPRDNVFFDTILSLNWKTYTLNNLLETRSTEKASFFYSSARTRVHVHRAHGKRAHTRLADSPARRHLSACSKWHGGGVHRIRAMTCACNGRSRVVNETVELLMMRPSRFKGIVNDIFSNSKSPVPLNSH